MPRLSEKFHTRSSSFLSDKGHGWYEVTKKPTPELQMDQNTTATLSSSHGLQHTTRLSFTPDGLTDEVLADLKGLTSVHSNSSNGPVSQAEELPSQSSAALDTSLEAESHDYITDQKQVQFEDDLEPEYEIVALPFLEIGRDPALVPEFLENLEDLSAHLDIPKNQIKLNRRLYNQLLGGSEQSSYTRPGKEKKPLSREFDIDEYFNWKDGGEPLFPAAPGQHGAAITFAIRLADGRIIHENGPASALRDDPRREVMTFMCHQANEWLYMGTYRHGRDYEELSEKEFAALHTDDKFWWLNAVFEKDKRWAATMFVDAGLAADVADVRESFSHGRVFDMMHKPDPETGATIIFYWRYLECVGYNVHFYRRLVEEARKLGFKPSQGVDTGLDEYVPPQRPNYQILIGEGYESSDHSDYGNSGRDDSDDDTNGEESPSLPRFRARQTRATIEDMKRLRAVVKEAEHFFKIFDEEDE